MPLGATRRSRSERWRLCSNSGADRHCWSNRSSQRQACVPRAARQDRRGRPLTFRQARIPGTMLPGCSLSVPIGSVTGKPISTAPCKNFLRAARSRSAAIGRRIGTNTTASSASASLNAPTAKVPPRLNFEPPKKIYPRTRCHRAVAAYQDFIRVEGWAGNLSILIEAEFFGVRGPSANFKDRHGREGRSIRGLTVEEHLVRLRESLLPLSERCGRVMREALASLETLRVAPSQTVERSRPVKVSVRLGCKGMELI
jgi:hypothetical protein